MELAALVSFALLVIAWIVAPDGPRSPAPAPAPEVDTPMPEAQPVSA
jgi:hypothetical protein